MKNRVGFWPPPWMIEGLRSGHNGTLTPSERAADERDSVSVRREYHGATYAVTPLTGKDRHSGDRTPHGVPPEYAHPMDLTSLIVEDAPRALPVTQEIQHGPEQSRSTEFARGSADDEEHIMRHAALLVHAYYATVGFKDRRIEGRRFRQTNNVEEMDGPQQPYDIAGWQRDIPIERYMRSI